ncbi:MAG TPA: hypothetical protein VMS22_26015 [Candidatus Eisenbacteria bacterium]|nr:hypothetical protein [Candidatus Eisenbacteria bacterium]
MGWRMLMAAAVLVAGLAAPRPVRAEFAEDAGWGVLTVLANVGYMPAKIVYSVVGGLTGGFAYVCTGGDTETASNVWSPAMSGTYVLTPAMIRGEESIAFAGPMTPAAEAAADPVADAAPADEGAPANAHGRQDERLPSS